VPRAYEEKGAYDGQICVRRGLLRLKKSQNEEKGAYKIQNEGIKKFALQILKSA